MNCINIGEGAVRSITSKKVYMLVGEFTEWYLLTVFEVLPRSMIGYVQGFIQLFESDEVAPAKHNTK